jgi:hypothetical protein
LEHITYATKFFKRKNMTCTIVIEWNSPEFT